MGPQGRIPRNDSQDSNSAHLQYMSLHLGLFIIAQVSEIRPQWILDLAEVVQILTAEQRALRTTT